MPPQRASSLLKRSGSSTSHVAIQQLVDGLHSPVQLAAVSNYKLAQLTFAPPDMHSLRKTALIKNTVEYIYNVTPPEWLDEMTRWQFFTLESLDEVDMTQEGLETILSEYVHIMESFKALAQEEDALEAPQLEIQPPKRTTSVSSATTTTSSASDSSIDTPTTPSTGSLLEESHHGHKPPALTLPSLGSASGASPSAVLSPTSPTSPTTSATTNKKLQDQRRKSFRLNHHRISWTSDTGLPSFAASQHLAGELMSLFDMEFKIDISLNLSKAPSQAPQLPELSYFQEKKNNRSSVDSFMCLIPAFESFQIDGSDGASYVSRANKRTSIMNHRRSSLGTSPVRSSSLKYKSRLDSNRQQASSTANSTRYPQESRNQQQPQQPRPGKALSKKRSIRRLVSMFGKKKMEVESAAATAKTASTTLPPIRQHPQHHPQHYPGNYQLQQPQQQHYHHNQSQHQSSHTSHASHQRRTSSSSSSSSSPYRQNASNSSPSPYHAGSPQAVNASIHSLASYQSVSTVDNEPRVATVASVTQATTTTGTNAPPHRSNPLSPTQYTPLAPAAPPASIVTATTTTRAQRRRSKSLSSLTSPPPLAIAPPAAPPANVSTTTSPVAMRASPIELSPAATLTAILGQSTSAQELQQYGTSPPSSRDQQTFPPRQSTRPSFYGQQELRRIQSSSDLAEYANHHHANAATSTDSLGKKQSFMQRMTSLATRRKKTFKMSSLSPVSA
ncbi:hypothetical protein BC940DRAFT_304421 [Gongronella butleri]|nr:hypothetical protein BC940DRAFT_304421 [Gongronella butleri]